MSRDPQINQAALLANIAGQVGCLTVIIIGLAFGAGMLLDQYLSTHPIFTILFIIGSVPVTLYVIVRYTLAAAERVQQAAKRNSEEGTAE